MSSNQMTVRPRISSFIISGIIACLVSTQLFEASLLVAPWEQVFGAPVVAGAAVADVPHARKSNRPGTDPAMTASTADNPAFPEPTAGQTIEPFARGKGRRTRRAHSFAAGRLRGGREIDCRPDVDPARRSLLCIDRSQHIFIERRRVEHPVTDNAATIYRDEGETE